MASVSQVMGLFLIGMLFMALGDILEYSVSMTQSIISFVGYGFLAAAAAQLLYCEWRLRRHQTHDTQDKGAKL
jgi:hypothetical protein